MADVTTQPGQPQTTAKEKAWVVEQAQKWFHYFQLGHIESLSDLSPEVGAQLTPDTIRQESDRLQSLGKPLTFSYLGSDFPKGSKGYYVLIQFPNARIIEALAYDAKGKIAGIDFKEFEQDQSEK